MSVFERQRLELETRLVSIVEGTGLVNAHALFSLNGALDDLRLDEHGLPIDPPGSDTRGLVEHALCRIAHDAVGKAGVTNHGVMDSTLPRVLDLALVLSELGISDHGSVFVVVQQVFETTSLNECGLVFGWVESVRGRLSADHCWKRGKLTMLRTCNELQKRLSVGKLADVVFKGRVACLLSALYPLSERSALNISGAYNDGGGGVVEDVFGAGGGTDVDTTDGKTSAAKRTDPGSGAGEKCDARADVQLTATSTAETRAFYKTFWNLQSFFKNPGAMLRGHGVCQDVSQHGGWNAFRESLDAVLDTLDTHRLDLSSAAENEAATAAAAFGVGGKDTGRGTGDTGDTGTGPKDTGGTAAMDTDAAGHNTNAPSFADDSAGVKYLTAAPLLRLQLADANFRRHFLTQCAVFLNFAEQHFTGNDRNASVSGNGFPETANGAVSAKRKKEAREKEKAAVSTQRKALHETTALRKRVFSQITLTPPNGPSFAGALAVALSRENSWSVWKKGSCVPFERDGESSRVVLFDRVPYGTGDDDSPPDSKRIKLGNKELDRLWNLSHTNHGALVDGGGEKVGMGKQSDKSTQPSVKTFLAEIHEDADPDAQIEESYKRKNDQAFRWKTWRLLATENLSAFLRLAGEDVETIAAEVLGEKPWPGAEVEEVEVTKKEKEKEVEAEKDGKEDAGGDGGDGAKEKEDSPNTSDSKKKSEKVQKTKTKTGGGEHLRFADGDATPETRGGDDSDMGTESGDTQTAEETETR
jgi:THO complex subunit 1